MVERNRIKADGGPRAPGPEPIARIGDRGFTEGPVDLGDGTVACTSMTRGEVLRWTPSGVEVIVDTRAGPTGLARGADDALYIAQNSGFWGAPSEGPAGVFVLRGDALEALRTDVGAPNDLCFGPDDRLYFTDPVSPEALTAPVTGHLFACGPAGADLATLTDHQLFPNGLAFDEADNLFVAESYAQRIVRIALSRGQVREVVPWAEVTGGLPDGICFDEDGTLYVAVGATDSIHRYDGAGHELERIELGDGAYPSNCCFAGPELDRLFVTAAGTGALIELDVGVRGLPLHPFR